MSRRHGLADGRLSQRVGAVGAVVSVSVSPNELDRPLINTSGIKTPELSSKSSALWMAIKQNITYANPAEKAQAIVGVPQELDSLRFDEHGSDDVCELHTIRDSIYHASDDRGALLMKHRD